jgi:hypothetical protein
MDRVFAELIVSITGDVLLCGFGAESVTFTVNPSLVARAVGVPEIVPLLAPKVSPAGSEPEEIE